MKKYENKYRLFDTLAFGIEKVVKNVPKDLIRWECHIHNDVVDKIRTKNGKYYYRCDVTEIWSRNHYTVLRRAEVRSQTIEGLVDEFRKSKRLRKTTKYCY